MSAVEGTARRVGTAWKRIKSAGFWLFLGASVSYASVLYAGPTRIEWSSGKGLVAEIGYENEMRPQIGALNCGTEKNPSPSAPLRSGNPETSAQPHREKMGPTQKTPAKTSLPHPKTLQNRITLSDVGYMLLLNLLPAINSDTLLAGICSPAGNFCVPVP